MSGETAALVWAVKTALSTLGCEILIIDGQPQIKGLKQITDVVQRDKIYNACKAVKPWVIEEWTLKHIDAE